jgi:maltose O-acetyltransferase
MSPLSDFSFRMFSKRQAFWHCLAEAEAMFAQPGSRLRFRRRELRAFGVRHGEDLWVGRSLRIQKHGGIFLGERAALGDGARLVNWAPIEIGDDFLAAEDLLINAGSHDPVTLVPRQMRPVRIGNRVWCGTRVTILAGVHIGDDVVVGAGSVVVHDVPANSIVAGTPARVIRPLERDPSQPLWTWAQARSEVLPPANCGNQ